MRSSVPSISAIGDIAGPPLLAHKASEEGVHCVELLSGLARPPLDHWKIPACIYSQPQVAWIGRTEAQARAEFGNDLLVGRFPFQASGKAVASAHTAGFVKILAEPRYREIVGAHVVGAGATELIAEIGLAMTLEATTSEIAGTSHAHPTLSEAILEAALAAEGRGIHL
jgi:dihydrolipoamide dehydrogenase